jgi:acyl-CoA synthetase (AMP-forming)/AMP-acid ligase II
MTLDLSAHRSVGEAFNDAAARFPDRAALTIYRGGGPAAEQEALSYAALGRRARMRAAWLAARLPAGQRVLLVLPTGTDFAEYYLGCLLAGLAAVPAPLPANAGATAERVGAIAQDCQPALVLTTAQAHAELARQLAGRGLRVPVEVTRPAEAGPAPGTPGRDVGPDTLAVIQYSSGSTGAPRGVMLPHSAILANTQSMSIRAGVEPGDVFASWLPLHHDMGLFVMLTAGLLFGARVVLMSPNDFVRRPVEWLRMLDQFGGTFTAGPNFAFDLCARAIPDSKLAGLDLSRVRFVLNGSEPIHPPTMAAFSDRFAAFGLPAQAMSPCYGLAEATAYVSTSLPGADPVVFAADPVALDSPERPALRPAASQSRGPVRPVVNCGPLGDVEARVVDPATRRALPDGMIGEVWLRGPIVGLGYWGSPELTGQVFHARLAGDEGHGTPQAGSWLRTGDLGALVDGALHITGRIKELVIVRGRNLHPHDVEQEARAAHEALRGFPGAAFGVAAPDERMVLVHEVSPKTAADELPVVAAAVSRRLTTALGIPVRNVVLVRRGTVRRTTSGKIQRAAMRERFLAGDIAVLHAELDPEVRAMAAGGAR